MRKNEALKILGVDASASQDAIKKAYRKLVMQHHPDRETGDAALFLKIKEAFNAVDLCWADSDKIEMTLSEAFFGCTKTLNNEEYTFPPGTTPLTKIDSVFPRIVSDDKIEWGYESAGAPVGDMLREIFVSPFTMMLGGFIKVKSIDTTETSVRIPKGLAANSILKVKDKGYWSDISANKRGDLFLRIIPDIKQIEQYSKDEILQIINYASQ